MADRSTSTAAARGAWDQRAVERALTLHERFLKGAGGQRLSLQFAHAPRVDCRRRMLNEADFTGANLEGAIFTGSHLERASLYCVNLEGCDLRAANLRRADLRGAKLAGAMLSGAAMDEADMRAAYIVHAAPDGGLSMLRHGEPRAPGAAGADFSNCAMRGVRLCSANLKGANFTGALLDSADFTGARLADAIFQDTILTGVRLDGLNLSPAQLRGCVFDPDTVAVSRGAMIRDKLRLAAEWVESGGCKGAPAVIDGEDLRPLGAAFRGRSLTALSARNVLAVHVDFTEGQFQGAVFDNADLRGAFFDGADLRGASFRGAKLSHARFVGADIGPLVTPNGRAYPACFDDAAIDWADFTGVLRS